MTQRMKTRFFVIMGVAGCGKTSVGKSLAQKLGWDFYDADDFHPPENVAKMANGIPLNDSDRAPWLDSLHDLISSSLKTDRPGVLACSAQGTLPPCADRGPNVRIVYLKVVMTDRVTHMPDTA
jgi:gluconokinase